MTAKNGDDLAVYIQRASKLRAELEALSLAGQFVPNNPEHAKRLQTLDELETYIHRVRKAAP
jgi:hypothetical protein